MTMFIFTRFIVLPLLLVLGGVWVDLRTRRGYGLTLLATALIALDLWGFISFELAVRQAPDNESFGAGFVMVVFLLIGWDFELILWIGALVESSVARQGWWIAGLVGSAVLPGLLTLVDILLGGVSGFGFRGVELALLFILPTAAVLTFSVWRIIRPVRQLAGGSRP